MDAPDGGYSPTEKRAPTEATVGDEKERRRMKNGKRFVCASMGFELIKLGSAFFGAT